MEWINKKKLYTVLLSVISGVRLGQPTRQPIDDRTAEHINCYSNPNDTVCCIRVRDKKRKKVSEQNMNNIVRSRVRVVCVWCVWACVCVRVRATKIQNGWWNNRRPTEESVICIPSWVCIHSEKRRKRKRLNWIELVTSYEVARVCVCVRVPTKTVIIAYIFRTPCRRQCIY